MQKNNGMNVNYVTTYVTTCVTYVITHVTIYAVGFICTNVTIMFKTRLGLEKNSKPLFVLFSEVPQ